MLPAFCWRIAAVRSRPFILLLVASLAALSREHRAWATEASAASIPRLPATTCRLANGFTTVVQEDHSQPVASVELWVRAGSADDDADAPGLAHLLEHALPFGDRFWSNAANATAYRQHQLDSNGQTRNDYTRFFVKMSAPGVPLAIAAFAERLAATDDMLTADDLAKHREIVASEDRNAQGTDWDSRVTGPLASSFWGESHPYGHTGLGSLEALQRTDIERVRTFHQAHYGAANALLIVAGDADARRVCADVEKYFGDIAPGTAQPRRTVPAAPARRIVITGVSPRVYARWRGPTWGDPDDDAGELLLDVLRARLATTAGVERITSRVAAFADGSEWRVDVRLTSIDRAPEVERSISRIVGALVDHGPSASELEAARSRWLNRMLRRLDHIGFQESRGELLGEGLLYRGDPDFYHLRIERVRKLTAGDLRATAARRLADAPVIAIGSDLQRRDDAVDRAAEIRVDPPPAARPVALRKFRSGALTAAFIPRKGLPLARVEVTIARDAPNVRSYPVETWIASRLDAVLTPLGAESSVRSTGAADRITYTVEAPELAKSLRAVAALLLEAPAETPAAPSSAASRVRELLPLVATAGLDAARAPSTRPTHANWLATSRVILVVAGDVDAASAWPVAREAFAAWPSQRPVADSPPTIAAAGERPAIVDDPGASDAVLLPMIVLRSTSARDRDILEAAELIIRSRAQRVLREEKHWTYGVSSGISTAGDTSVLWFEARVPRASAADAMNEFTKVIEGASTVKPESVAYIKGALARAVLSTTDSVEGVAAYVSARMMTAGAFEGDVSVSRIDAMSPEEFSDALARVVNPSAVRWIVIGNGDELQSAFVR